MAQTAACATFAAAASKRGLSRARARRNSCKGGKAAAVKSSLRSVFLMSAAVLLGWAERASACGSLPCAQVREVQPNDIDAPLNAEVRVLYFGALDAPAEAGCEVDLTRVRLVPSAGEPVEFSGTLQHRQQAAQAWLVAKPPELLEPNTDYAVELRLGPGDDACRCDQLQWTRVAAFTTAASEDASPPEFAGLQTLKYGPRAQSASDCGESDGVGAVPGPEFTEATDEYAGVRYDVYVDGMLENRFIPAPDGQTFGAELVVDCGSTALNTQTVFLPGSRVELRAVDVAGNESAPHTPVEVADVCMDARPVDADAAGSAGSFVPSGGVEPEASSGGSSGCTIAPGVDHGASLLALACVIAQHLRRRRRGQ